MRSLFVLLFVGVVLGAAFTSAFAAEAPVTGVWTVKGKVDGFPFTLWCDLKQVGEDLSGVCRDNGPKGKAHPLKSGFVHGDKVRFVYESSYLISKFDAVYEGVLAGDAIVG